MVQQAQPAALLQRLSQELGLDKQEFEARARQSKLGYAAQIAAVRSGCNCEACRLLRATVDGLVDEAMREVPPVPSTTPAELA